MKKIRLLTVSTLFACASMFAQAADFDLKDPKGVNNISFSLDAPLESIQGTSTGVSGTVSFDPAAPESTTGMVVVQSDSLHVGNPEMLDHIKSGGWLNVKKYPEITFELVALEGIETEGNKTTATAKGTLTLKGESKEIEAPVSLTYLEGMLKARSKVDGDLLVVRSTFTINRSDFGIKPGQATDKVSEEIELSLSLAGSYAH